MGERMGAREYGSRSGHARESIGAESARWASERVAVRLVRDYGLDRQVRAQRPGERALGPSSACSAYVLRRAGSASERFEREGRSERGREQVVRRVECAAA